MAEERIISDRALGKLGVFHGRVGLCEGLLAACQTQIHLLTDDGGGSARMRIDIEDALFKTLHDGGDCLINGDNTHCERQRFILIGLRIGKALDQCGRSCR